jgi:hypothetical protein
VLVNGSYIAVSKQILAKQSENNAPALGLFGVNFKSFSNTDSFHKFPI